VTPKRPIHDRERSVALVRGVDAFVRTSDGFDLLEYLKKSKVNRPGLRFGFPVDRLAVGQTQGKSDKGIVWQRTPRTHKCGRD